VDPPRETFTIFLKAVGVGSRALADLRPGEAAGCLGPLGRGFREPPLGHEALLVAGGYGIAPFKLFCDELVAGERRARVFYGGRRASDLLLRAPFTALGVPLVEATEDGSLGHRGRVTEPLERYLDETREPVSLYACGPDAMLHAVARLAERRGLAAQVSVDPWMGCGVGTCLGCVVRIQRPGEPRAKYRCACTEGPVFDAREVVWAEPTPARAQAVTR
jgi:dihydroorotate dehydrogenase electron transfer subunit